MRRRAPTEVELAHLANKQEVFRERQRLDEKLKAITFAYEHALPEDKRDRSWMHSICYPHKPSAGNPSICQDCGGCSGNPCRCSGLPDSSSVVSYPFRSDE